MDTESSLNRAGTKGSENYRKNAEDVSELVPFSKITLNQTEEVTGSGDKGSPNCPVDTGTCPNCSCPVLRVTTPSVPNSRSPSPLRGHCSGSISEENRIESGRLDNVSVALTEYHFSDSQERSLVSFNSTLPKGNVSEAGTETSDRTKSTTPASSIVDAKDEDEQVLEVLRMVVRKCTNLEPNKRPTSDEVHSLLISSLNRQM